MKQFPAFEHIPYRIGAFYFNALFVKLMQLFIKLLIVRN